MASGNTQGRVPSRPNIIIILADDMGFSDIGCYGSEIDTPNLDRLARNGVRFSQMYNCARCCPSRASLLTGLYPHQAGVGHMVSDWGAGTAYQGYLSSNCVTIAEVLKNDGYKTLMSGKWHVGGGYQASKPETWSPGDESHPIPVQRGFDRHYGMLGGAGSYFYPPYMIENENLFSVTDPGYYLTDAITDNAISMIEDSVKDEQPFFLYVAYTAPHWPLHALPEDIARYEGKYRDGGWDAVRMNRYEELRSTGILDPLWDISPRDGKAPCWEDVNHKDWEDMRMSVYAAQVDRMDQGIGRIMTNLRQSGLEENTLVMFLSDNGGCAEFLAEDTNKPQPFRYNIPTPDGRPIHVGNTPNIQPGPDDTFMSYDLPWANASNTPFRLYKHWVHEGGIATPFIVYWPQMAAKGHIVHSPCHLIDIMATCLDAAGAKYPEEYGNRRIIPLEGESFLPVIQGKRWQRQQPIFWEHEGNRAVRDGNWKLVSKHPGDWELYNMLEDRTELDNRADSEKQRVRKMSAQYRAWAKRCGVMQWPPAEH